MKVPPTFDRGNQDQIFFFFFFFFGHTLGMWTFPGQTSNPSHSYSNVGSLNLCTTRELPQIDIYLEQQVSFYFSL